MVAMAPMSVRLPSQQGTAGNQVTAMSLPVRSDIEDPLDRLMAVHDESTNAKKLTHTMGPDLTTDAAEFLPSTVSGLIARTYAQAGMADRLPPLVNTVITNIPGVNVPLYSMGSQMVSTYGLGPVTHGVGLFQPVISYNNTITVSAVADRDMMPDPAFYAECLQSAFDDLKSVTIERPAPSKKKAKKKKVAEKKAKPKDSGNGAIQPGA